jgi:D-threonine aldolase
MGEHRSIGDLPTPALVVEAETLEHNLAAMAAALPGPRCRPHVKAHKTTQLAARQVAHGHHHFTCATPRELVGLARAGVGNDFLLANEVVDPDRLRALAALDDVAVSVAVDSDATVDAAAAAGIRRVLVDVNVGMPRCGCSPEDAARLADRARGLGMEVGGVMGYEGHVVGNAERKDREEQTAVAMELLMLAHDAVGGDVISAGGTTVYDINTWATEIQAGSYALMDATYDFPDLPFRPAMAIVATVISVSGTPASGGWAVADCGVKALGMDHGNPLIDDATVWFCSDEHVTFGPESPVRVGDRVRVKPTHVDPTVACHERMFVVDGDTVVDEWEVDLRGW